MTLMITILLITIILFIWGKFSPDIVALISMIALFTTGILNLDEVLSGFSNPTVIMIASLFIIGEGLSQTGWTALAGKKLLELANKSESKLLMIITLGAGLLSGDVSNTGTVATLLPAIVSSAWSIGTMPSKILMLMAFGSNTGAYVSKSIQLAHSFHLNFEKFASEASTEIIEGGPLIDEHHQLNDHV